MGNEIVWLNPFNYPQKLSFEVDYSIMLSFLELYTSLLKFVNFKLYKDIGLDYPPRKEVNYRFKISLLTNLSLAWTHLPS